MMYLVDELMRRPVYQLTSWQIKLATSIPNNKETRADTSTSRSCYACYGPKRLAHRPEQPLKPQSQLKVDEVIVGLFQCLIVHQRIFGT